MESSAGASSHHSQEQNDMIRFLKRYTPISDVFIDDFFGMAHPVGPSIDPSFPVDATAATKWLKMTKGNFMRSLRLYGFEEGIDFKTSVEKTGMNTKRPRRRPIHEIRLTTECFKGLCMMLNTQKSKDVRAYFIAAEETLLRYREDIQAGLQRRIDELERNQRGPNSIRDMQGSSLGVIYVVRAHPSLSIYKLGRTKDIATRLRTHETALAHGLEILVVFKTQHMDEVESCVKSVLKSSQYKKRKEVFQTDIDTIKKVIATCDKMCTQVKQAGKKTKVAALQGGSDLDHYVIMHHVSAEP